MRRIGDSADAGSLPAATLPVGCDVTESCLRCNLWSKEIGNVLG